MENRKIYILGVGISFASIKEIKENIKQSLLNNHKLLISTPNPEIILSAQEDEEFHFILNHMDLSIADGIGLKFASWLMGKNLIRWPGSQITIWLLNNAEERGYKVAILNKEGGLSSNEEIAGAIKKRFPKLNFIVLSINQDWSTFSFEQTNEFQPDIIFVGLGYPNQEKFIYHNSDKFPNVKIMMGVGGSLDYLSGKIKPAPIFFRNLGLEWMWRLINLNSFSFPLLRVKRIARAVIIFPLYFLKWRFINPLIYRKNVACLLYKKIAQDIYILIIERNEENQHWQIPQGGTDGSSLIEAGMRELREECNIKKLIPKASFANIHKYKFPAQKKDLVPVKFRNYKGQKQGLFIAEYTGDDKEIKISYWEYKSWQWIHIDQILEKIHPNRKEITEKFINILKKYLSE